MKTDRYTKTILTVIAICLTFNVLSQLELVPKAYAAEPEIADSPTSVTAPMDVRIVGIDTYDNLRVDLEKVSVRNPLEVKLKGINTNDRLKVDINEVSTNDELKVDLSEIDGNDLYMATPIPVKVK